MSTETDDILQEYSVNAHQKSDLVNSLNEQRKDEKFCDTVLVADGKKFNTHKCVLVASSPYFQSMFEESHFAEASSKEIELKCLSSAGLEAVLDMIYTGILKLKLSNIHDVIGGCDHLLLTDGKQYCAEFMLHVLRSKSAAKEVLRVRRSAELFLLSNVLKESNKVISENFDTVVKSDAFFELNHQELKGLLQEDEIDQSCEYTLWSAVTSWINRDQSVRQLYCDILMPHIRFSLMSGPTLVKLRSHPLMSSAVCQKFLSDATSYKLLEVSGQTNNLPSSAYIGLKPRCCIERQSLIFCCTNAGHFMCYVPKHNKWYNLGPPIPYKVNEPKPVATAASVKVQPTQDNNVFAPKSINAECGDEVQIIDVIGNDEPPAPTVDGDREVKAVEPAGEIQIAYQMISAEGNIYVATASKNQAEVDHFELKHLQRFDLKEFCWKECTLPMNVDYAVLIECRFHLYSCSRQGVEKYNLDRNEWEFISEVRLGCRPCRFVVSDNSDVYFYNLEDGTVQEIHLDRGFCDIRAVLPMRLTADVHSVCKLPNHEVLVSLRTLSGETRKVFNVKTNLWKEANLFYGNSRNLNRRAGVHYPQCLNYLEQWQIVCDREDNPSGCLYILSPSSGFDSVPTVGNSKEKIGAKDGILPFYKFDLGSRTWTRLAGLPESLSDSAIKLCIYDQVEAMATCI